MNATQSSHDSTCLVLHAETAADLMTKNPLSIRCDATIHEAAAFLIEREISGAPVVDDAGRAVGVISHTDIVRHDSEAGSRRSDDAAFYREGDGRCPPALREFIYGKQTEAVRVGDVMSPVVIQVSPGDSALSVVAKFLALKIHRLFVVDESGTPVGVISALDILRCLARPNADVPAQASFG